MLSQAPTEKPSRPRASSRATRERILDAARELFDDQGYEATSLKEVAVAAGVNGGSLYHFFPTKARLVEAVLEQYLELLEPVLLAPARAATTDPIERIMHLFAGYRAHLVATAFGRGCPIGSLALELGETTPVARALVVRNFDAWRAGVAGLLDKAGLPPEIHAPDVAAFVLSVIEGAVMQSRSYQSAAPFDASVRQIRAYLEGLGRKRGRR